MAGRDLSTELFSLITWFWEMVTICLSVSCFIAILTILLVQGMARSQLKWISFRKQRKPLTDIQLA